MKPHTHSNVARHIVNSLAIAKIDKSATFIGKIYEKHDINVTTSLIIFRSDKPV